MYRLQELRKTTGLSQNELVAKSGVARSIILKYENGQRDLNKASGEILLKLSQALNCKMEDLIMYEVINKNDTKINFDAAVQMMDDDIREDLHADLAPCSDQVFFTAYEKAHEEKYGEEWELSKVNPVY